VAKHFLFLIACFKASWHGLFRVHITYTISVYGPTISINGDLAFKGLDVLQNYIKNGEGGIRTRGAGLYPHDGLANRCLKPLGHLSKLC
jgi:hypothetical protein